MRINFSQKTQVMCYLYFVTMNSKETLNLFLMSETKMLGVYVTESEVITYI